MNQKANTESLTDKAMSRDYIEQNNIIERYILNQLSTEEMDAFEDRFTFDPELYEEIAATEKLIEGFQSIDATFNISNDDNVKPFKKELKRRSSKIGANSKHSKFAIAACILLSISTGALLVQNISLQNEVTQLGNQVNISTIHIETARNGEPDLISYTQPSGLAKILIDRGLINSSQNYHLQLLDSKGQVILESEEIAPTSTDKWQRWIINGSMLESGTYNVNALNQDRKIINKYPITFSID